MCSSFSSPSSAAVGAGAGTRAVARFADVLVRLLARRLDLLEGVLGSVDRRPDIAHGAFTLVLELAVEQRGFSSSTDWLRFARLSLPVIHFNITKERCFCGPPPKVIQGVYELISSMFREFQLLGSDGKSQTVPEYPKFAWFEGLANAVTHRDYSFSG